MNREERLLSLFDQFDASAKQFCEETNGIFCEISSEYKGEELPRNLKFRFAKLYYRSVLVQFTYTAHGPMNVVNSVLSCSMCLDKSDNAVEIPLPLMTDYLDLNIATPLYIPLITTPDGMMQAYRCIGDVVKQCLSAFEAFGNDREWKTRLMKAYFDEMATLFDADVENDWDQDTKWAYNNFFFLRFSSDVCLNILKGNRVKATKQLSKLKDQTGYEKRLIGLLALPELEMALPSEVVANSAMYNDQGVQKSNFKEFGALFLSWLLFAPIFSLAYLVLFSLLVLIEGRESIYLMGPIYNFPYCILCGFVTSVEASYFTRFKMYKWIHKKDYETYCAMDHIQNGGKSDRLMKRFLTFIMAAGVILCGLLARWNLNFLPDGFVDNSKFFTLRGEYHAYDEIERVYYRPDRVNDFGDTLEFPSYVIVLKDGTEIDLYEHGDIGDYDPELLDALRARDVPVENKIS